MGGGSLPGGPTVENRLTQQQTVVGASRARMATALTALTTAQTAAAAKPGDDPAADMLTEAESNSPTPPTIWPTT